MPDRSAAPWRRRRRRWRWCWSGGCRGAPRGARKIGLGSGQLGALQQHIAQQHAKVNGDGATLLPYCRTRGVLRSQEAFALSKKQRQDQGQKQWRKAGHARHHSGVESYALAGLLWRPFQ